MTSQKQASAPLVALILAAGKGTRMHSKIAKVLHTVGGVPMLTHVLNAATSCGATEKIVVVGHDAANVEAACGTAARIALQSEQLGTGHAVMAAAPLLKNYTGDVLILCGDTPLLKGEELAAFLQAHRASKAAVSVLTTQLANPTGYGRIKRDAAGNVIEIVEEKDATAAERRLTEVNSGIYCLAAPLLLATLTKLKCANAQGEYYLTDLIAAIAASGQCVHAYVTLASEMLLGVNSQRELARAEAILRREILNKLMDQGVTLVDPATTYIDATVQIAGDCIIRPCTYLEGATTIGAASEIGPNVRLTDSKVGAGVKLQFLYAHACTIGDGVCAGPYVHLRPGTVLQAGVKIGNFVEVKNSTIGNGTKLPHLSYIGDSDIGAGVNMGCGSITVNYDGVKKERTQIGDHAFIGCNSNLVAPVTIGAASYIAAGSTITKNVPDHALAVARSQQKNIDAWAAKRRPKDD